MITMSSVPSRFREGMMFLSGDSLLLFNPLQIDYSGSGAAILSFKEDVGSCAGHGTLLRDEGGNVRRFLHEQTVNGEKPVLVTLEKQKEKKFVFDSRDMDVHGEFDTIEPLQITGDPYDSFALQKASLLPD